MTTTHPQLVKAEQRLPVPAVHAEHRQKYLYCTVRGCEFKTRRFIRRGDQPSMSGYRIIQKHVLEVHS